MKTDIKLCVLFLLVVSAPLFAQTLVSPPDESADRTELIEPFQIIDNIYYVGPTVHNTSYLITSSEGHIVIDTVYAHSVPTILQNVKKLGFDPEDIKYILSTHAHEDHVAGHSKMKESTGARILSSAADKKVIETGGKADFRSNEAWPSAKVDRIIEDGEEITLGDTVIKAHLTPGHTKGCTTYTMIVEENMKKFDVIFLGGLRVASNPLLGHPMYPNMAEDFAMSFAKLKSLPVDVYLGGHGYWNGLGEKIVRMNRGEGYNAFIDPEGYRKAVDSWQQEFVDRLIKESKALIN